jgi:hypothetical protein
MKPKTGVRRRSMTHAGVSSVSPEAPAGSASARTATGHDAPVPNSSQSHQNLPRSLRRCSRTLQLRVGINQRVLWTAGRFFFHVMACLAQMERELASRGVRSMDSGYLQLRKEVIKFRKLFAL